MSVRIRSAIARNTSAAAPVPASATGFAGVAAGSDATARAGPGRAAAHRSPRRAPAPPPSPNSAYDSPWSQVNALMFSITPTTFRKLRWAMSAARWATFWAASAGVVTTIRSVLRQHPRQAHLHVAGAGRHVDEQVVERAPLHVAEELLDGLGEHQAAPHERGVLVDEEAGRDDFEQAIADDAFVRDDHRLGRSRRPVRPPSVRRCRAGGEPRSPRCRRRAPRRCVRPTPARPRG